jgi:hypothetical protein
MDMLEFFYIWENKKNNIFNLNSLHFFLMFPTPQMKWVDGLKSFESVFDARPSVSCDIWFLSLRVEKWNWTRDNVKVVSFIFSRIHLLIHSSRLRDDKNNK